MWTPACHFRQGMGARQHVSDAVTYALRCQGYDVINYCDDFVRCGMLDVARKTFSCLHDLLTN